MSTTLRSKEEVYNDCLARIKKELGVYPGMVQDTCFAAMEEYANQFRQLPEKNDDPVGQFQKLDNGEADELWDEVSELIGDDIDSLSTIAGTDICKHSDFIKVVSELYKPLSQINNPQ